MDPFCPPSASGMLSPRDLSVSSAIDRPLSVIRLSKERNWERKRGRKGNDELAS